MYDTFFAVIIQCETMCWCVVCVLQKINVNESEWLAAFWWIFDSNLVWDITVFFFFYFAYNFNEGTSTNIFSCIAMRHIDKIYCTLLFSIKQNQNQNTFQYLRIRMGRQEYEAKCRIKISQNPNSMRRVHGLSFIRKRSKKKETHFDLTWHFMNALVYHK